MRFNLYYNNRPMLFNATANQIIRITRIEFLADMIKAGYSLKPLMMEGACDD